MTTTATSRTAVVGATKTPFSLSAATDSGYICSKLKFYCKYRGTNCSAATRGNTWRQAPKNALTPCDARRCKGLEDDWSVIMGLKEVKQYQVLADYQTSYICYASTERLAALFAAPTPNILFIFLAGFLSNDIIRISSITIINAPAIKTVEKIFMNKPAPVK